MTIKLNNLPDYVIDILEDCTEQRQKLMQEKEEELRKRRT